MVRASASGAVGRGFAPRPRHTKGGKNGTGSSLADACNKRVVPETIKPVGIRYLLCRSKSSAELMLSNSKHDVKQSFFILNEDMYKSLNEFEFRPDLTTYYGVIYH